jgi:ATP-dependent protease ClpP protease subunit
MPVYSLKTKQKQKSAAGYRMAARNGKGEIYLYGVIGETFFSEGVTATQFAADLKALGNVSAIDLRINSEGGDVFHGRTIYTLLKDHPAKVTVYVDGLAASIASLIAMAGDEIIMGEGTFMMIHNPWTVAMGDSNELRRMADLLDTIGGAMVDTYVARTGAKKDDVVAWLNAETWMTSQEAIDRGFADKTAEPMKVAACINLPMAYKNLPASLRPNRAAAAAAIARIQTVQKKS